MFRRGRARGTGIAYVDVEWPRFPGERSPRIQTTWDPEDARTLDDVEHGGFDKPEAAIAWARARAPIVLVRLGPDEDQIYSAGERPATRELPEFGGTDLTEYPMWPPEGRR